MERPQCLVEGLDPGLSDLVVAPWRAALGPRDGDGLPSRGYESVALKAAECGIDRASGEFRGVDDVEAVVRSVRHGMQDAQRGDRKLSGHVGYLTSDAI